MTGNGGTGNGKGTAAYLIGISTGRNSAAAVGNGNVLAAAACINDDGTAAAADYKAVIAGGQIFFLADHGILELVDFSNLLFCVVGRTLYTVADAGLCLFKRS